MSDPIFFVSVFFIFSFLFDLMEDIFDLENYNYELPWNLIAQEPIVPWHNAKLLIYDQNKIKSDIFLNIDKYLPNNVSLFFNDSKVIKARIPLINKMVIRNWNQKILENWEIFVYDIIDDYLFECLVSDWKHFRPWTKIIFNDNIFFESLKFSKDWILMKINGINLYSFLDEFWKMPLPPYISYEENKSKFYQTEFSSDLKKWSVASPTAWLHFTNFLLNNLSSKFEINYLTLHVWLWTFKPIYEQDIRKFDIHQEHVILSLDIFNKIYKIKKNHWQIMAVWTTSCRVLESLPYLWTYIEQKENLFDKTVIDWRNSISSNLWNKKFIFDLRIKKEQVFFDTKIYIYPGFEWKIVDILCTNFHLPKTSLLLLVSSFLWWNVWKKIYNYAINNKFRFYSFGDWMLLYRHKFN